MDEREAAEATLESTEAGGALSGETPEEQYKREKLAEIAERKAAEVTALALIAFDPPHASPDSNTYANPHFDPHPCHVFPGICDAQHR